MMRMMRRFQAWRTAERGFTTATIAILMMPVLIGAMGYSFDNARLIYAKQFLQGRADLAAQAALTTAGVFGSTIRLDSTAVQTVGASDYCNNTAMKRPQLLSGSCNAKVTIVGSMLSVDQLCAMPAFPGASYARYGVTLNASETIPTMFMQIVGIQQFDLSNITSTSLIRGRNC